VFSGINFWARVIDSEVDVDVGSKMWNVSWSNMLVSGITQALVQHGWTVMGVINVGLIRPVFSM
jgi:hypothetical protein